MWFDISVRATKLCAMLSICYQIDDLKRERYCMNLATLLSQDSYVLQRGILMKKLSKSIGPYLKDKAAK